MSTPIERAAEALYTPRWDSHGQHLTKGNENDE